MMDNYENTQSILEEVEPSVVILIDSSLRVNRGYLLLEISGAHEPILVLVEAREQRAHVPFERVHAVPLEYPLDLGHGYLVEPALQPVHIKDGEGLVDVEAGPLCQLALHLEDVVLDLEECEE